ncbi:uncharacterized protein LOC141853473 isoform X2 [Brevipalpus obovatus]|uniref:uncharacterized protein LOC141853473 isoform X2 n=1 Tax=Brevipalpus obovatus TaxID=246614 RepID=UPI003D9E9822
MIRQIYLTMNFSFVFISIFITLVYGYDHNFDQSIEFGGDSEFTTPKDNYLDHSYQTGPPWSNDQPSSSPIGSPFIQNYLDRGPRGPRGPRGSDSPKFNGEYSDGFTGFHFNHDTDKPSSHEPLVNNEPPSPDNHEYVDQRDHYANSGDYANKDSPPEGNSGPSSNDQYNIAQYDPDAPNDVPNDTPSNSNYDPPSSYNEVNGESYDDNEQYSGQPYGSGGQGNSSDENYSRNDSPYQSDYPDSSQYDQPNDIPNNEKYDGGYNENQQNSVGDDYENYNSYQQENTSQLPPQEQSDENGSDYHNKMDYLYKDSPGETLNRKNNDFEVREVSSKDQANSSVRTDEEKSKSSSKASKNGEENSNGQRSPLVHLEFNYGRENGGIQAGIGGPGLPPGTHLTNNYHFAPVMTPPQHSPYIQNQIPSIPVYTPNYQYNQNGQQYNPNNPISPVHNPNYQYNQRDQQQIQPPSSPNNPSGAQNNNKNTESPTQSPGYVAHLYLPPVLHKPKDSGYIIVDSGNENREGKSLMHNRQDSGLITRDEPLIIVQEPRSDDSNDCGSKRKSRRESRKKRRRCYKVSK